MQNSKDWNQSGFLFKAGIIVGSGGFIFGYDIGVISGTLHLLREEFCLTSFEEGLVVSILYAGSILGSVVGGPMCDRIGRWNTIQIQNIIFVVGAICTGLANSVFQICIGRFIVGIAAALSGIADVPYLAEISPDQFRGFMASQYEMLVCIGILFSFSIGLLFADMENGWRIAFILPAGFAFLQSFGLLFLPDSPKWLMQKGRLIEARSALEHIYGQKMFENIAEMYRTAYDDMEAMLLCECGNIYCNDSTGESHIREDTLSYSDVNHKCKNDNNTTGKTSNDAVHRLLPQDVRDYTLLHLQQRNLQNTIYAVTNTDKVIEQDDDYRNHYFLCNSCCFGCFLRDRYINISSNGDTKSPIDVNNMGTVAVISSSSSMNHQVDPTTTTTTRGAVFDIADQISSNGGGRSSSIPFKSSNKADLCLNTSNNHLTSTYNTDKQGTTVILTKSKVESTVSTSSNGDGGGYVRKKSENELLEIFRYPMLLVLALQVLAQITGANVIRNFAPVIFQNNGVSATMALTFNVLLGVVKTLFTFISIVCIESTGRLQLLTYGVVLVSLGMLFLTICSLLASSSYFSQQQQQKLPSHHDTIIQGNTTATAFHFGDDVSSSSSTMLFNYYIVTTAANSAMATNSTVITAAAGMHLNPVVFVIGCAIVYAGFGLGYGPIPWLLSAEMFPTLIRGRVMSLSLIACNIAQLVANSLFLPIVEAISPTGAFGLFFVLNIFSLLFIRSYLVESKEIKPEEILMKLNERYALWKDSITCFNKSTHWWCCYYNNCVFLYSQLDDAKEAAVDDDYNSCMVNKQQQ